MGISAGKALETGRSLRELDPKQSLTSIGKGKFNGYTCVTSIGKAGLEEGTLVFSNGNAILASYEYFKYNRKYAGAEALKRFLNLMRAPSGIVDVFSLSTQEVQLVKALKEDLAMPAVAGDKLNIPGKFSEEYADQLIPRSEKADSQLMKRLGFAPASEIPYSKGGLLRRARKESE